jgi:hypothetical protein
LPDFFSNFYPPWHPPPPPPLHHLSGGCETIWCCIKEPVNPKQTPRIKGFLSSPITFQPGNKNILTNHTDKYFHYK